MDIEEIETNIVAFANELGRWPSIYEWGVYSKGKALGSYRTIRLLGGNFDEMRIKHGFKSSRTPFTKEDCITALVSASDSLGKKFTMERYRVWSNEDSTLPKVGPIKNLFGTFNKAKQAAGLSITVSKKKIFTVEEIKQALLACAKDLGNKFNDNEYTNWNNGSYPSSTAMRILLKDSINDLKKELGLDVYQNVGEREFTDSDLMNSVKKFIGDQLRLTEYEQWSAEYGAPSIKILQQRLGKFTGILEKAQIERLVFVGHKEAADIMGWSKQQIDVYMNRGKFPEPIQRLASGPIWIKKQIEDYAESRKK
jgi:predicted DNA-binding transcriptional regulator AlpA